MFRLGWKGLRIILTGVLWRRITEFDVARHRRRFALTRRAIAATAGGEKGYRLSRINLHLAKLAGQLFVFAAALDARLVDHRRGAAEQSPWRALDAVGVAAQETILQRLEPHFDAVAAAKLAGAAAVGAKGVALVEQWIVKFL